MQLIAQKNNFPLKLIQPPQTANLTQNN